VLGKAGCWLPGGGTEPGETPEDTVRREVREELGRHLRIESRIGEARQYFFAAGRGHWYDMTAVFFRAELEGDPAAQGQLRMCWLDPEEDGERFFHACHAWAALQS
jgi:8-oxo-dGTP pyrophosphatase MutT (NUDIX family)